jgi:uncharacterized membrane protein YgaE (UPF0421/DUF939 family)
MDVQALVHRRWLVLRPSLLRLFEASVAASLAWWLAHLIPHHPRPFFAPIAAVIAMGAPTGTRGRQAVDLLIGVMLGIGIAALIATVAGTGTWQIGLAAGVAMVAGILIDGRPLVVTEAGVSAVLLLALHQPGAAPGRLIDALIGGGVSIAIAQVLFPVDPLKVVARAARELADDLAGAVQLVAVALRDGDLRPARRALSRIEAADGSGLTQALEVGRSVVRRAPRRRWERRAIEAYAEVARELSAAAGDAHGLASGALRALREHEQVPADMPLAAEALAAALHGRDVKSEADSARAAAGRAVAATPTLAVNVFAHAVDEIADHAERAAAAVASSVRTRGGL